MPTSSLAKNFLSLFAGQYDSLEALRRVSIHTPDYGSSLSLLNKVGFLGC